MKKRKLFGTDGIRGKANVYPMTCEVATALGRAVTQYFKRVSGRHRKPLIIVGKDTRLSCYMIEQAFAAGVCSQGGEVILTGPLPTPGIAFCTQSMRADAGVMISASHNSFEDNGIKIFDHLGYKLPDEVELELEEMVLNPELMAKLEGAMLGNAKRLREVFGRYIVQVKNALAPEIDLEGVRMVLDCANGAGYKVAPMVFQELGAEVFPLGVSPNGQNINDGCGSLHPEKAKEEVLRLRADIGICLDGDADRVTVIDRHGNEVDGDQLIGLLAKNLLDRGIIKKKSKVVGTVMSNLGLESYLHSQKLEFMRSKVGDRYIMKMMRESGALLGGEPSGHIILGEHATTGDGILAALKVLECVKMAERPVDELVQEIPLFPMVLKNVKVTNKPDLESLPKVMNVIKSAEKDLGDQGRLLVRYSGTEPLARVMVEGSSTQSIEKWCGEIAEVLKKELS